MAESTKVQTGKVFDFDNGVISEIESTGSFEFNTDVLTTAGPRARVPTIEILSDGPSAVAAGVEKGAEKAVVALPTTGGITGRIAPVAGYVGMANDTINVGQHVAQGNGAEAATEGLGVAGQASGAWVGAEIGAGLTSFYPPLVPVGVLLGAAVGALGGASGAKSLGTYLTGGDTPDKMGPPQTLPAGTPLEPTITTADGDRYALVQVDGKYTWFAMLDNSNLNLSSLHRSRQRRQDGRTHWRVSGGLGLPCTVGRVRRQDGRGSACATARRLYQKRDRVRELHWP